MLMNRRWVEELFHRGSVMQVWVEKFQKISVSGQSSGGFVMIPEGDNRRTESKALSNRQQVYWQENC